MGRGAHAGVCVGMRECECADLFNIHRRVTHRCPAQVGVESVRTLFLAEGVPPCRASRVTPHAGGLPPKRRWAVVLATELLKMLAAVPTFFLWSSRSSRPPPFFHMVNDHMST